MCTGAPTGTPGSTRVRRPSRVRLPRRPRRARASGWTWMSRPVRSAPRRSSRSRVPTRTGVPRARATGPTRGGVGVAGWPGVPGACRRRGRARCRERIADHTSTSVLNAPRAGRIRPPAPGRCGWRTPRARPVAPRAGRRGRRGPRRSASCHLARRAFGGGGGAGSSGRWRRRECSSEADSSSCRSWSGWPRHPLAEFPPRPRRLWTRSAPSRLCGSRCHPIKARSALPQQVHDGRGSSRSPRARCLGSRRFLSRHPGHRR